MTNVKQDFLILEQQLFLIECLSKFNLSYEAFVLFRFSFIIIIYVYVAMCCLCHLCLYNCNMWV